MMLVRTLRPFDISTPTVLGGAPLRWVFTLVLTTCLLGVEAENARAQSPVSEVKDSEGSTLMTIFDNGRLQASNGYLLPDGTLLDEQGDLQLSLPFSSSVSSSTPLLELKQTGDGGGALFEIENALSTTAALAGLANNKGTAIEGLQVGSGHAGVFRISDAGNASVALEARTNGNHDASRAGLFKISNSNSSGTALVAETKGTGLAAEMSANKVADPRGNPRANVALVKNTSPNDGGDVLGLQAGQSGGDVDFNTNFISFHDNQGTILGTVQGNGAGGIELTGTGADFAEELPVADGAEAPEPTDLVGVRGGQVSMTTEGADRVMIASSAPAVTGNATPQVKADDARRVKVAFVGQVPVRVRGPVKVGDWIVASGQADGTARAVAPSKYRRSKHGPIAGQAWAAKATPGIGTVRVAVGLGSGPVLAERLADQQRRNDRQQARIAALERRLRALETERSSALASLGGSMLGFLVVLLGGLTGALFWHRRR